ncbi:MAG: YggT family protein [Deltaproteobacteria bacterium]|nr:YggT family protein [Deltaproteobacteria bacterium]
MTLFALFLIELSKILSMLLQIYTYVILIAVLLSWVNPDPYNPLVRFLRQLTEPVFHGARRLLPAVFFRTGIDFSPIIVLLAIMLIRNVLLQGLFEWAVQLRMAA